MNGLLVVERTDRFERTPVEGREIVANYRGIEGTPWPDLARKRFKISCGLAMPEQLESVLKYYDVASKKSRCDLLYIHTHETPRRGGSPLFGFSFCGFDYGNYISENNFFSVIFNEMLLGKYDELLRFRSCLNRDLLFSNDNDFEELELVREKLTQAGADLETVETDEEFCKIRVSVFAERGT
jgi:hypothetical protein